MADPISISGLVVSAIQLVDVGIRFCRETREIYQVGSSSGNKDVQTTTSAFVQATRSLQDELSPFHSSTSHEAGDQNSPPDDAFKAHEKCILDLAQKCTEIGSELESKLQSMELSGRRGRIRSMRQAGKNIWNNRKIEAIAETLDKYRCEMQTQAMFYVEQRRLYDAEKMLGQQKLIDAGMKAALARMESRLGNIEQNQPTVEQPHESTFSWVFNEFSTPFGGRVDFTRWLARESGIFWISGKAGSGKSTLVKHICTSERTTTELGKWSHQHYLMTAAFFAWSSGTSFERTEHGFCRSVLHQLLSGRPDLVERVLPGQYQVMRNISSANTCHVSTPEFRKAFAQLARFTSDQSSAAFTSPRICIFLDGLDELEGGLDPAIFLQDLTRTHCGFKVVVSGRPLNQFDAIFKEVPQIRVQDLTFEDICNYVNASMNSNAAWYDIARTEKARAEILLREVVSKADGVFLWVALVIGALKSALDEGDTMTDLFAILDELPNELETLYQHMFAKMKPRHRQQAAQYLSLFETFRRLYPENTMKTLYLALTEEDSTAFINECRAKYIDDKWKYERCVTLEKRLKARCCGLLEVRHHGETVTDRPPWQLLMESQVQYLHKSAIDFLAMDGPRELITKVQEAGFDADLQLAKAQILLLRGESWCEMDYLYGHKVMSVAPSTGQLRNQAQPALSGNKGWLSAFELLLDRMRIRASLQTVNRPPLLELLVSILNSLPLAIWRNLFETSHEIYNNWQPELSTFFFAVQAGLAEAVNCELGKMPSGFLPPSSVPWLKMVYQPMLKDKWRGPMQDRLRVAELLIKHGASLSEVAGDFTHRLVFPPNEWTCVIPRNDLQHLAQVTSESQHTSNPAPAVIQETDTDRLLDSQQDVSHDNDSDWLILDKRDVPGTRVCARLSKTQQRMWDRVIELLPGLSLGDLLR
ncbi:hypothetical protein H2200_010299 [Cladophialophora chaetospira]|uniref:NACHT domain-containing protein n=1 Tax=Cladophialophora chaetospira TaxID=386627 RepID=A0AA39CE08_9EURO|nr:hypothetical protein H2200_010299 [Cladophialophora chaetospira]